MQAKEVRCETPRRKQPAVACGALVARRTPDGWQVVCPTCKEPHTLTLPTGQAGVQAVPLSMEILPLAS